MTAPPRKRVSVLISGRGSNMAALVSAAIHPAYPAKIVQVISNRADARGLETAARAEIATRVIAQGDFDSREAHETAIDEALKAARTDIVCLAGYMRLLTEDFVKKWQGRMINIHPSLLPSFTGLDTHARILATGCRIHGATVHFVTADMDEGPIIAQAAVPVLTGDTEDALAARVLAAEHRLYPAALNMVAGGTVRMSGGGAVFSGTNDGNGEESLFSPDPSRSGR